MTTMQGQRIRNRDMQDGTELHVWGNLEYVDGGGSIVRVRGTDTEDSEAIVMNSGYGFNLPADSNAEVPTFYMGSDTTNKYAMPQIPHDQQRQWTEGTGGVQHPTDKSRALEFNDKRAYVDDENFATRGGVLEVIGDTVFIRGNVAIDGDLAIAGNLSVGGQIIGPMPSGSATVIVPSFDE